MLPEWLSVARHPLQAVSRVMTRLVVFSVQLVKALSMKQLTMRVSNATENDARRGAATEEVEGGTRPDEAYTINF